MKSIVQWFVENHVASIMLKVFVIVAGLLQLYFMKVEVFPDASLGRISISVAYPNASPQEVEEAIVNKIEEQVMGLEGIRKITSTSSEGVGTVIVEVMEGWNVQDVLDKVKTQVSQITTFPKEAEPPVIQELIAKAQVIDVVVYGDVSELTLKRAANLVKEEIIRLPHVSLAQIFGSRESEIHIDIPEENLLALNMTLGDVARIVNQASLNLPAGKISGREQEILLRATGRKDYAYQYRNLILLSKPNGALLRLSDVGSVKEGFEDINMFVRFNGKPAILIMVYRVADQNALTVAKEVKALITRLRAKMPEGIHLAFFEDMSIVLKDRIFLLLKNLTLGFILVVVLLWTFLDIRLSFWVSLGIPFSFLAAFSLLPYFDVSINMVSLFALIMVLGIVVDDAIVIGENVFRKATEGLSPKDAAIKGTVEVGYPVIFSVLTSIVAFAPLIGGSGMMGKIIRNIPIVVILVLFGSLLEAILILPSHLSRSKALVKGVSKDVLEKKWADKKLKEIVEGPYRRLLSWCINWRYVTVSIGILMLFVSYGIWKAGWLKYTFFPEVESDWVTCSVKLPPGSTTQQTVEVVSKLEQKAFETINELDPRILKNIASLVGLHAQMEGPGGRFDTGSHLAQVFVELISAEKRKIPIGVVVRKWRKKVKDIPDIEEISFHSELFTPGKSIEVNLMMDNPGQLKNVANELKALLARYPGVFDIADSLTVGKPELRFKLLPWARSMGISLKELALQVRHSFYGAEALRFQRDEDEVKVLVRYPDWERKSIDNFYSLHIKTPKGKWVPLINIADVHMSEGYTHIEHENKQRVVKVTADVDETVANAKEIRNELSERILPELANRFNGLRYSFEGEAREERESMRDVLKGFGIAILGIYTLLAIPSRSFLQPLIVMAAIPFGIIGAIFGHILMGYGISIVSLFGIVGLTGVVVNDSLVLVDKVNSIRQSGKSSYDALLDGTALRFRAIILTSVTTFVGLMPIIFERSLQARVLIPMAIGLGFGILFATVITLIIVPCFYLIVEDLKQLVLNTAETGSYELRQ